MRRVRRERVHVPVAPPCADSGHEAHELDEDLIAVEPGQASVELLDRALPLLLRQPVEEVRMDLLHLLGEMTEVSADSLVLRAAGRRSGRRGRGDDRCADHGGGCAEEFHLSNVTCQTVNLRPCFDGFRPRATPAFQDLFRATGIRAHSGLAHSRASYWM